MYAVEGCGEAKPAYPVPRPRRPGGLANHQQRPRAGRRPRTSCQI